MQRAMGLFPKKTGFPTGAVEYQSLPPLPLPFSSNFSSASLALALVLALASSNVGTLTHSTLWHGRSWARRGKRVSHQRHPLFLLSLVSLSSLISRMNSDGVKERLKSKMSGSSGGGSVLFFRATIASRPLSCGGRGNKRKGVGLGARLASEKRIPQTKRCGGRENKEIKKR